MWNAVVDQHIMGKSIWPELHRHTRSMKYGTDGFSDDAVITFHTANFAGRIGSSDFDGVPCFLEKIMYGFIVDKLTTLIKADSATRAVGLVLC